MSIQKVFLSTFLFLTAINIVVFIFRDHFTYQPYTTYLSLYAPCNEQCTKKWKQYANDYSSELKEAKQITDSVVRGYSKTSDKVIAIENFLYTRFHKRLGQPTFDLLTSSPLTQFKKLNSSDTLELWCSNFAQMFSLFCWSQQIIARNVELFYPEDHHVINECYIPESGSWMIADITTNLFAVKDQSGKFLNLLSFKDALERKNRCNIIQSKTPNSLEITSCDSVNINVQYKSNYPITFYYYTDNDKAYATVRKIKRYFLPQSWYELYHENNDGNMKFYLKEILAFLWLVSFFVFLLSLAKFKP